MRTYHVYILASRTKTLYVGVTGNLLIRVHQHREKLVPGFTCRYNINRLVYYEETSDIEAAIFREKQIKGWVRRKKIELIESFNPEWEDLSSDWYSD